jgi:signal transduction histidine kinase
MQNILVIDDDDAVRNAIFIGLTENGYRCLQGINGREGMEVARKGGLDLILCDLNLGGTDEHRAFVSLREYAATLNIPFIVMTGQPDEAMRADGVLVKPFTMSILLDKIRSHLEKRPKSHSEEPLSGRKRNSRKPPVTGVAAPPAEAVSLGDQLSNQELEQILAREQASGEEERKQLARIIHDDLTQTLTVVAIELSLLESNLRSESKNSSTGNNLPTVEKLMGLVNDLIRSAQEITARLHPKVLDEFGLVAALEWLAEQVSTRMKCELSVDGVEVILESALAARLYRICEEVLSNAAQHARASEAYIRVAKRAQTLSIEIKYNGKRLEPGGANVPGRLELAAICKRVERLGGRLQFAHSPGQFMTTRVEVQIPL